MELLTEKSFCYMLGVNELSKQIKDRISELDFRYEYMSETESNDIILKVLKRIDSGTLSKTGNKDVWEKGWSENLEMIKKTNDISSLIPKYTNSSRVCRFNGKYIKTVNTNFEFNVLEIFRMWASQYLISCESIFEFGSGSGQNLISLVKLFPNKVIHGLDWTKTSVEIINEINDKFGYSIYSHIFDLYDPDYDLVISENSGIITIGCMEQIYFNYKNFVDFLLWKRPNVIIHLEPILEFYDDNNLLDYLSIKFHTQRNYLLGYYTYLKKLEFEKKIRIIKENKSIFGNMFNNLWSILIWEII